MGASGLAPVAKMDATKAPISAKRYELAGFPTIMVFKGGQMVEFNGMAGGCVWLGGECVLLGERLLS